MKLREKSSFPVFFLFLFFLTGFCFSQDREAIDSLENLIGKSQSDTNRVHLYLGLCHEYEKGDLIAAGHYADSALKLSEKINYNRGIAESYSSLAALSWMKGNYLEALEFCNKNLEIFKSTNDKKGISKIFGHLGLIYSELGNYSKTLEYYYQSLKINEETNDTDGICIQLNNIGIVYADQDNNEKALEFHLRSLKIAEIKKDKRRIAGSFLNIGVAYKNMADKTGDQSDFIKAADFYEKALKINEELNDKRRIASCLNNLANVYSAMKNNEKALMFYTKALKVRTELGDRQGIATCLINIGSLNKDIGNFKMALDFLKKGEKIALEIGSLELMKSVYIEYSQVYFLTKNYEKAYEYHNLYAQYKDSLLNEESSRQIAEMQISYESEKKQKEIELLNKEKQLQDVELEKKDAEVKKQNTQKISIGAGLVFVLILALLIFKGYRQKVKSNLILSGQKQEIEIKNSYLEKANAEINVQKKEIEEKNHEILASIRYAQRIQEAILPPQKLVTSYLENTFILYKPKDIVAGDFYWFHAIEDGSLKRTGILLAACDCTGHGVPGAFMSIIGYSALNSAVKEFGLSKPSEILDKISELMEETFSKSENEMKDGMDIALCSLAGASPDRLFIKLQYAGANNSIYLVRAPKDALNSTYELIEIKADKQPIGKFAGRKPFTNHELELRKGDAIYAFSDGYADQFGGPKGKKFKYSQFEKLLVSVQEKPMEEQRKILDMEIEKWRGTLEQIDDICIWGIKI